MSESVFFNLNFAVTSEDFFPLVTSPIEGILPSTGLNSYARNFLMSENKGKNKPGKWFCNSKAKGITDF